MDEKPRNRRLRFGLRTMFEIIAVVAFILALIYYRATPQGFGRYQIHSAEYQGRSRIFVLDTQTGQLWRHEPDTYFIDSIRRRCAAKPSAITDGREPVQSAADEASRATPPAHTRLGVGAGRACCLALATAFCVGCHLAWNHIRRLLAQLRWLKSPPIC